MTAQLQIKDDSLEIIAGHTQKGVKLLSDFYEMFNEDIKEAGKLLALAFSGDRHVFCCGYGLSAAIAQILAKRFIGSAPEKPALPAIVLTTENYGHGLSNAGNGVLRQLEALGSDGDILILFTALGEDTLLAEAARTAHEQGMFTLGITGGSGGCLSEDEQLDLELRVPSIEANLVHEVHISIAFLLGELTDYYLYTKPEILNEMLHQGVSKLKSELSGE